MRYLLVVLAAAAAVFASSASADYLKGNPKVCSIGSQKMPAAYCAQHAAMYTLKAFMTRKTGKPWDANITCTAKSGLTVWACTWTGGAATVTFRGTANGWKRIVTTNG